MSTKYTMSTKHTKFTITTILIFSLLVPMIPAVLAEDICTQAKNATCDDVAAIDGNQVQKTCSESIFQKYSQTLLDCKAKTEEEMIKLDSQIEDISQKERSAEWYLSKLNLDIRYLNYEIANLNLSISQLESEIKKREEAIRELDQALEHQKSILSEALRQVYEYDLTSYVEVLLGYGSLSDFGSKLMEVDKIQIELRAAMSEIQKAKDKMETEKVAMEKDTEEKSEYKKVQEYSKYSLAIRQDQQEYLLRQLAAAKTPLEREMARIEAELIELKAAMNRIQSYLYGWLGYQPSWTEIFNVVARASQVGVRQSFLLATLQIESGFGYKANSFENRWGTRTVEKIKSKCGEGQLNSLLAIQKEHPHRNILDPTKTPMSYACAMGPGQFLPTTWWRNPGTVSEGGYKFFVATELEKIHPDPWNLLDATVGTAIYMKRWGAGSKTYTSEWKAAMGYLTGDGWTPDYCKWDPTNPGENLINWDNWYDKYFPFGKCNGGVNCNCKYGASINYTTYKWQEVINICGGLDLSCPQMESRLRENFGYVNH